jgi:hypothetical protein
VILVRSPQYIRRTQDSGVIQEYNARYMAQEINLGGTIYISSKRAAEITGYTQDYVGQLARGEHILAQRVSGLWYVVEESLRNYKTKADEFKPTPPPVLRQEAQIESAVSFDGKDYVSAQRAAEVTGYHPDYVGQLARNGKVLSRQVGNRWFVDREAVVEHKRHNDALLAAVQAESVGLLRDADQIPVEEPREDLHFIYKAEDESKEYFPKIEVSEGGTHNYIDELDRLVDDPVNEIPIRVIKPRVIVGESYDSMPRYPRNATNTRGSRLISFTATAAVLGFLAVGIGYMYTYERSTVISTYNASSKVIQSAASAIPVENIGQKITLPALMQNFISNDLYFRRDSF